MKRAVVAHAGKTFGSGLSELRRKLDEADVSAPLWIEVTTNKRAPRAVKRALEDGADDPRVGRDGMVQRGIDALKLYRADYDTTIRQNAFGTFEDVLTALSLHPAMRVYLELTHRRCTCSSDQGTQRPTRLVDSDAGLLLAITHR